MMERKSFMLVSKDRRGFSARLGSDSLFRRLSCITYFPYRFIAVRQKVWNDLHYSGL